MHEMSLAQSIADIALEEAKRHTAMRVKRIFVDVGALACVDPHALSFGFEAVANGTPLAGTHLEITTIPAEAYCFACEKSVEIEVKGAPCPTCQTNQLIVRSGDDLQVKEMEII